MSVFGSHAHFAVEHELGENHGGEWMFGNFCYWCGGTRIGDYELGASLRDVLFQLDHLAKYRRLRGSVRFRTMRAATVFSLLDMALYGVAEPDEAALAEEEQWDRHKILPEVDVFDGWKGFLIEGEQADRLIFACEPYIDVTESLIRPGDVDTVLDRVRHALNEIYERTSNSGGGS